MPGRLESLLRSWGDYIGRVDEQAVRMSHQAANEKAVTALIRFRGRRDNPSSMMSR